MTDQYVRSSCILAHRTANAIQVDQMVNDDEQVVLSWIPRSLIHGGDDLRINHARIGDVITFRLRAWKAAELGL